MKPRVLSPYKILTIAAFSTGTAGGLACTTTPHAAPVASNVTLAAPAPPSPPPRTDTGPATVAAELSWRWNQPLRSVTLV